MEDRMIPIITKRELFATAALQGMVAKGGYEDSTPDVKAKMAEAAVACADALIVALRK